MPKALHTTRIKSLPLLHKGKVRDIYDIDDRHMLIVTTDRISAFDVVMPTAIPGKGMVLNQVTRFHSAIGSRGMHVQICSLNGSGRHRVSSMLNSAPETTEQADRNPPTA